MHLARKHWQSQIVLVYFVGFLIWWVLITTGEQPGSGFHQSFAALYGLIAIWGGIWGLVAAKKWGGFKSLIGKALIAFSFGLFAQEFGQLSYSYYIYYLHQSVPYPSIGDVGYFASIPLYIIGTWHLLHASGIKTSLHKLRNKIVAIVTPMTMLIAAYVFFLKDYQIDPSQPLKLFLDFGYPLGEAIYVSIALLTYLLSRHSLGGIMRSRIVFILIAMFIQFCADFTFLFQAQYETWYAGGVNDLMYFTAYVVLSLALIEFDILGKKLVQK